MGVLDSMFARSTDEERDLSLTDYAQWVELGISGQTASGVSVTPSNSLNYSAVYGAVRILAETLASLPLIMYERTNDGKRRAPEHPLYAVLKDRPNEWMTSFELRETLQSHLALWGNAYSLIDYRGDGQVDELFPLRPDRILRDDEVNGERLYQYQLPSGDTRWLSSERVWHLRGLGSDGKRGYSPIHLMRRTIGLGVAAEEFGARFFGNDARPGGVLEHPSVLGDDAQKRLRESWEARHSGLSRSHKIAILEEGMKYHEIGLPPEDAQFLQTRKFQIQEVARMFRIPPHMLGDLDRATFSNIEQQSIEFVTHSIRPWLVRWEQSIKQNLMLERDRDRYFPEFLVDALLRGDTLSRYQAYAVGRQNGWLSANDIRKLENQNPVENGDQYLVPLNMVPAGSVGSFGDERTEKRSIDGATDVEKRGITLRRRIQQRHRPLFRRAFADIYAKQRDAVLEQIGDGEDRVLSPSFLDWMQKFFEDNRQSVIDKALPLFQALAGLIAEAASDEVGSEIGDDAVENLVKAYAESFADRVVGDSQRRLIAAMEKAANMQELPDLIRGEVEDWPDARAPIGAQDETVQLGNAAARMAFVVAGVASLVWRAIGDSCPYCRALDGQSVGNQQYFLQSGEEFEPEGADRPLTTGNDVRHPPAHSGCDCMIAAGI